MKAELAKRTLRLHSRTANNTALMALQWPSVRARILVIKLSFLLYKSDLSLSARVFRSLAASDVESLIIIRQYHFLESTLNSNFTSTILTSSEDISLPSMKKEILQLDLSLLLSNAASHLSQKYKLLLPVKRKAG